MILLVQSDAEYEIDLRAMVSAFFLGEKVRIAKPEEVAEYRKTMFSEIRLMLTALYDDRNTSLKLEEHGHVLYSAYVYGDYKDRKRFRNKLKLAIYRLLSEYTGRTLPWGSLTGMRPTKIAASSLAKGKSKEEIVENYMYTYDASEEKASLATRVAMTEQSIIEEIDPIKDYILYIGIPFCPTRCLYCSFAAYSIHEYESEVDKYLETLKQELTHISFMNRHRRLVAVYIGGGTPTSLSEKQLEQLMVAVNETFDMSDLLEFTVEAGRPDSITREKLEVLKKKGCTRISINPQTMNSFTLRTIGRAHTPADIKWAMNEARKVGFKNINMDIIAGLPGERLVDLEYTLGEIEKMMPESLTVHSLAIKRAAKLNQQFDDFKNEINKDTDKMLSMAAKWCEEKGLQPYYLYRQKNIAGNLENVGYSKPGLECVYNVLIMEERIDTFAAGAGGITRLLSIEDGEIKRVDRVENVKNVDDYITRIDEMIERKSQGIAGRVLL